MRKTLGLLTLGLGLGLGAGMLAGPGPVWPALVLIGLGALLLIVGIGGAPDLVGEQPVAEAGQPVAAGLGTRVEAILELAEQQAAATVREAQEEAGRIVADARTWAAGQPPG
jgi:hypothetical protein